MFILCLLSVCLVNFSTTSCSVGEKCCDIRLYTSSSLAPVPPMSSGLAVAWWALCCWCCVTPAWSLELLLKEPELAAENHGKTTTPWARSSASVNQLFNHQGLPPSLVNSLRCRLKDALRHSFLNRCPRLVQCARNEK